MEWTASAQLAVFLPLMLLSMVVVRRLIEDRMERKRCPLPPGPTPLPFLGSALSVSFKEPFKTYTEWREKYGDIVYVRLLGMDVVVVNTPSVSTELFEKRSQIYSDRPYLATLEPYGHDSDFAFAHYGDHWRLCRRIFHQTFRADSVVSFCPLQLRKARQLVLNIINDPVNFKFHYYTFNSGVTMCTVYDYDPKPKDDKMVSLVNDYVDASMPALMPERAILLEVFPFLLHLPEWIPWLSFKREARIARQLGDRMVDVPYQYVVKRMESKQDINPSMVSDHIARMESLEEPYRSQYEKALKDTAATAFLGGVETTSSSLITFTLAMVKNPNVWKRAQADIDTIVGTDRLPGFEDRASLPYVEAITRETLRWQPPVPLGAPHATTKSDIYNGLYIPKGATMFPNIWGMSRDETRYPDAEKFIPERFLTPEGTLTDDVPDFVFGFGRRACPGRYAVRSSLWICVVSMLATLDFNLAKDTEGKDIDFEPKFMNGIARHPLSFPCHITPRSHISKETIERVLAQ